MDKYKPIVGNILGILIYYNIVRYDSNKVKNYNKYVFIAGLSSLLMFVLLKSDQSGNNIIHHNVIS